MINADSPGELRGILDELEKEVTARRNELINSFPPDIRKDLLFKLGRFQNSYRGWSEMRFQSIWLDEGYEMQEIKPE